MALRHFDANQISRKGKIMKNPQLKNSIVVNNSLTGMNFDARRKGKTYIVNATSNAIAEPLKITFGFEGSYEQLKALGRISTGYPNSNWLRDVVVATTDQLNYAVCQLQSAKTRFSLKLFEGQTIQARMNTSVFQQTVYDVNGYGFFKKNMRDIMSYVWGRKWQHKLTGNDGPILTIDAVVSAFDWRCFAKIGNNGVVDTAHCGSNQEKWTPTLFSQVLDAKGTAKELWEVLDALKKAKIPAES